MCSNCNRNSTSSGIVSDRKRVDIKRGGCKTDYLIIHRKSRKHIDKNNLVLTGFVGDSNFEAELNFKYCPYCGRKL